MSKLLIAALTAIILLNPLFSFSEEIRYESGGRRDPFTPVKSVSSGSSQGQSMTIEGIIYDRAGTSVVVISGEAYKIGDTVGDQTVSKIYSTRVTMKSRDGKLNDYWISEPEKQK